MPIKMKEKLKDFKGAVVMHSEPTGKKNEDGSPVMADKEMRLGDVLLFALIGAPKEDTSAVKVARFMMSVKISGVMEDAKKASALDLSVAEIKTCTDAASEHLTTMFYGRVLELMDPAQLK